jgi:uncharacterized membrane protein
MTFPRSFAFALLLSMCPTLHAQNDITAQLTFTTIDVPGAGYTNASGINTTGAIVGSYGQDTGIDSHGFLYMNGTFTYFDYPGDSFTIPLGINDSGLIVGHAGRNPVMGFLYDGTTFTTITHGNDSATYSDGINNSGEVVGGTGTIYTTKGFQMQGGRFRALKVPGQYIYVSGSGVNNLGAVVGWADSNAFKCRASQCQLFDFPGANQTTALGINDSGVIVGWYNPGSSHDYAFAAKNGKFVSFSYPGAVGTFAGGINASGQVVGEYFLADGILHGFVTSPINAADFERPDCCVLATK